jgi:hypothetical protein
MNEKFLEEWFGVDGRELGCPERFYTEDPSDLLRLVETCRATLQPCYISVQPYKARDVPCALEKLYYDFDCKEDPVVAWKDACKFAEALKKYYDVEPLTVYSGRKGFHVYVFLKQTAYIGEAPLAFAKQVYEELQTRLVKGLKLPTLDPQPMGDIKRMARVPLSTHEKTGSLCVPVDSEKKPFVPESLDTYRTLDAKLLAPLVKELKTREKTASLKASKFPKNHKFHKGIRPCITAALEKQLEGGGEHLMRLAIAIEHLHLGMKPSEIAPLFQSQSDYDYGKSLGFVEDAKKRGYKPFKCRTIRELGFCLPDCRKHKND